MRRTDCLESTRAGQWRARNFGDSWWHITTTNKHIALGESGAQAQKGQFHLVGRDNGTILKNHTSRAKSNGPARRVCVQLAMVFPQRLLPAGLSYFSPAAFAIKKNNRRPSTFFQETPRPVNVANGAVREFRSVASPPPSPGAFSPLPRLNKDLSNKMLMLDYSGNLAETLPLVRLLINNELGLCLLFLSPFRFTPKSQGGIQI